MINVLNIFDSYSRQARLYPAMLVLFPALMLTAINSPGYWTAQTGASWIALAVSCGLIFLFADIARSAGQRIEHTLLAQWGGWPTTSWLRHSSPITNPSVRNRVHSFLSANVPGLQMPSIGKEAAEPAEADITYASATAWLKAQCRGPNFDLLLRENANYGFRRNMLGLKPWALAVCFLCIGVALIIPVLRLSSTLTAWNLANLDSAFGKLGGLLISVAINAAIALAWTFFVNPTWVRKAGDRYADTLFNCCDNLPDVRKSK